MKFKTSSLILFSFLIFFAGTNLSRAAEASASVITPHKAINQLNDVISNSAAYEMKKNGAA